MHIAVLPLNYLKSSTDYSISGVYKTKYSSMPKCLAFSWHSSIVLNSNYGLRIESNQVIIGTFALAPSYTYGSAPSPKNNFKTGYPDTLCLWHNLPSATQSTSAKVIFSLYCSEISW